jgi:ADP-ribosyl-[dinitrogen reductase] hydrolase
MEVTRVILGPGGADAVRGCLLGGALGDAFGGLAERGSLCLSDDTQLTLATCEAVVEAGRVDPSTLAAVFVRWFSQRRLSGLGASTLKALRDLQAGSHWALAGARGEMAAGNGGAMRIAPVAFLKDVDRKVVRDVVRITHHHEEAYLGALAVVLALRIPWPTSRHLLLENIASELPDCRVRDQVRLAAGLDAKTSLQSVASTCGSSGWVVETVPLALCAAWQMVEHSFEDTIDDLRRIGGDTDTIASIAGQLAGTRLGAASLPAGMLAILPERGLVEATAVSFGAWLDLA